MPIAYIRGHAYGRRKDAHIRHLLTEIDVQNRYAVCSRCGPNTIKMDKARKGGWRCTGQLNVEHRLAEVHIDTERAWCRGCAAEVPVFWKKEVRKGVSGGIWKCLPARQAKQREYQAENRERINAYQTAYRRDHGKKKRIFRDYGLSPEAHVAKLDEQNGLCAICLNPPKEGFSLCVDHCHETGNARGLLCSNCNSGIGMMRDNLIIIQAAVDYLTRWKEA